MTERRAAAGFSIAEVVVALGVLAGVLVSIAGLLVLGNRQVSSGRSRTAALAVASDVIERIGSLGFLQTHSEFGCDATQTVCLIPPGDAAVAEWEARLVESVSQGEIEIRLETLEGADLARALSIRVTVGVRWVEGQRARLLELTTVRS